MRIVLFLVGLLITAVVRWSQIFVAGLSCIFTALGGDRLREDDRLSK
jgi:hypothetical protein